MNFDLDVAVGRIPASNVDDVETYVNKVIRYETSATPSSSWFKKALLLTGIGGGRYVPDTDITQLDAVNTTLAPLGFTSVKLYNEVGYSSPSSNLSEHSITQLLS